ncbi:WD repeat domain-containing protein [Diplocarpon rosae]|nr:WD repeat domain-containing protein [Diplocarpon rosae]
MESAWLDSLSEDWVSQPRSSDSPAPSLPSLPNNISDPSNVRTASSRIPKYNAQKQSWTAPQDLGNSPLSERSTNDVNIPLSQRAQHRHSKLRETATRGRRISRTLSVSGTQSVQYHTIEQKSVSLSPHRGTHETPEWKRRLLHGDVAYGEQRDLFSPAGLENIFLPPPSLTTSSSKLRSVRDFDHGNSVMPSSPPPYSFNRVQQSGPAISERAEEGTENRQKPRSMQYRLASQAGSDFSVNDLSQSSLFQPAKAPCRQNQEVNIRSDSVSQPDSSVLRPQDPARTVSGQIDMRNEELSPIYVARHNTMDGKIDYAALNLPPDELKRRLESIREKSPSRSDHERGSTSEVLPANMTVETDEFAQNGGFVNLKRGGHSHEGSFQNRMLSSSSLPAIDESMQANTPIQLPNIRKIRDSSDYQGNLQAPKLAAELHTPHQSPPKTNSISGSPLKIFGTYDTFTNQKLLRRLSQFEDDVDREVEIETSEPVQEPIRTETNDAFAGHSSRPEKSSGKSNADRQTGRKMSSFGGGELDSFRFSEGISCISIGSNVEDEDREDSTLPILDRNPQSSFKFQLEHSPDLSEDAIIQYQAKYTTISSTMRQTTSIRGNVRSGSGGFENHVSDCDEPEDLKTPRKRNGDSEGKRLLRSPLKDPTPKRRRTLPDSDPVFANEKEDFEAVSSLEDIHHQMQSVVGRKRKDARHGDDQQAANPSVLAMRQILRPRTSTLSQPSSQQRGLDPSLVCSLTSTEQAKVLQEQKIAKIQAELDSTGPFNMSAPLGIGQHMLDENRKGSVTTQDFLDEAKKIMAGIRGKTRPRSGLASLEESESETDRVKVVESGTQDDDLEESYQESTQEPFSRPPSRDGKPVTRLPHKQEDPALLDHLRKYQERSDMDGLIASSMRSIAMAKEAADIAKVIDRRTEETVNRASIQSQNVGITIESEPPNIRISENPDIFRKRRHSTSSIQTGEDPNEVDFPSHGSSHSSVQSTARSIPTGSSRGSDSRRIIAPHTVSHLIPEQLAGMVFDHASKKWVKSKMLSAENRAMNILPSDETEDDPFGDIPDLSVDEAQELQRIKAVAAKRKEDERVAKEHRDDGLCHSDNLPSLPQVIFAKSGSSPARRNVRSVSVKTSEDEYPPTITPAPVKSEDITDFRSAVRSEIFDRVVEQVVEEVRDVEGEISINEDRLNPQSPRRRNVTISFSSPLASIIQPSEYGVEGSFIEGDLEEIARSDLEVEDDVNNESIILSRSTSQSIQRTASTKIRTALRNTSRRTSVGGHRFSARPVSRIDEQDEDSFLDKFQNGQQRSISIVVSTPVPSKSASTVTIATPRQTHEVGTLTLTPLPDFTVHQADQSLGLDVSYIAQGQRYALGDNSKKTLSLSIRSLVEKLTEVEPYEPFWEHMKELALKNKRLTNLHKLDEFCQELEELNVSYNQIGQLNGVPRTVRNLHIAHNCLTDLAAWKHLYNLQYIDVSNNELESLSPFKSLIHLRSLRADNNRIANLDGIGHLDGLLSLRLRGNAVQTIDFSGSKLQRLSDLDLKGNQICDVQNLQELRALSSLNLEDNILCNFSMGDATSSPSLKYLKLSGNNLESVNVSLFPNLRLLYLDRNRLGKVSGLLKTKYLDSLSMREQQGDALIDPSFLSEAFEVRKLFLSGNFLGTFEPKVDFLNLQYLELANCGLECLPSEFGQMIANTRVLNLNFNALKDIKPLIGILRLKKLHLAGNRLWKLRSTADVLAQLPNIASADLRSNPLTQGFYPPVTESRVVANQDGEGAEQESREPFTIGKADREKDDRYIACLDMDTRKLRRVFEVLVLSDCSRLRRLDGLDVTRSMLTKRDKVFNALVQAGVFEHSSKELEVVGGVDEPPASNLVMPEQEPGLVKVEEERWQAEDSFA